jgi:hypothetical protein
LAQGLRQIDALKNYCNHLPGIQCKHLERCGSDVDCPASKVQLWQDLKISLRHEYRKFWRCRGYWMLKSSRRRVGMHHFKRCSGMALQSLLRRRMAREWRDESQRWSLALKHCSIGNRYLHAYLLDGLTLAFGRYEGMMFSFLFSCYTRGIGFDSCASTKIMSVRRL